MNVFSFLDTFLSKGKDTDIVFADYGHQWEALRRVAHSAVQYVFPFGNYI